MRQDVKSWNTITAGLPALSRTVATYNTASIDHKYASGGAFFLSVGTFDTSVVGTLQYSANDTDWTSEPDATAGNDVSGTVTEAGAVQVNVPNPRARYSRLSVAIGGTNVFGVTSILGPLKTVGTTN